DRLMDQPEEESTHVRVMADNTEWLARARRDPGGTREQHELLPDFEKHAILRPAVLFGKEDILINNIAWALRSLPGGCGTNEGCRHRRNATSDICTNRAASSKVGTRTFVFLCSATGSPPARAVVRYKLAFSRASTMPTT